MEHIFVDINFLPTHWYIIVELKKLVDLDAGHNPGQIGCKIHCFRAGMKNLLIRLFRFCDIRTVAGFGKPK